MGDTLRQAAACCRRRTARDFRGDLGRSITYDVPISELIVSRLAHHRGNRTATADSLGISRKTLFNKMREYGISGADDEP